ncbi:MAG TPA: septation regulator SpoVG [Thermoanaerobaculia bacterium]|nr:septation regulator SpoVG [Thermoanaerobaculia bacterium]
MEITEVKVFPIHEEKLRAFVSIVFDHCFMVNDIKVIQGRDGLFISMPSRKKKNGEFKDIAHPLNNEARRTIEDRILAAFSQTAEPSRPGAPSIHPSAGLASNGPMSSNGASMAAMGALGAVGSNGLGGSDGQEMRAETPPSLLEPRDVVGPAAVASEPRAPEPKTLEELEELHLSDSFWSVT